MALAFQWKTDLNQNYYFYFIKSILTNENEKKNPPHFSVSCVFHIITTAKQTEKETPIQQKVIVWLLSGLIFICVQ